MRCKSNHLHCIFKIMSLFQIPYNPKGSLTNKYEQKANKFFLACLPEMHRDSCPLDCKVYVGNLGNNGNKTELERAFGYYGPLRSVWVARNPPGFAFVEFEDPRDAADAVRELDGR